MVQRQLSNPVGTLRFVTFLITAFFTQGVFAQTPLFLPAVNYSTGGQDAIFPNSGGPVWLVAADVNGDGKSDLLVANWCEGPTKCTTSNVGILLNTGDGTFQPVVAYDAGGSHAFSVSVADVNGDGKADLIVAIGCADIFGQPLPQGCPQGSVGVLLGNGDGTFQTVHNYPSGGSTSGMALADLNQDGKLDVVVSNCAAAVDVCPFGRGVVGVLLGNGDGTFQPVQTFDSGGFTAYFVAIADVNGDHHPDLLVSNQTICANCKGNLGVLLGHGNGTFQTVQGYDVGIFSPANIVATDLNGDNKIDVAITENIGGGGELAVLLNRGDGTFQSPVVYSTGGLYATPLVVSDINSDGKRDLLVSNAQFCPGHPLSHGCIGVLLGNGDGSFQPAVTYDSGGIGAWWLTVSDLDGDDNLDVAVANQCSLSSCGAGLASVGVLIGNGDGTFRTAVPYNTDRASVLVLAADLNGDDKADLAVGNAGPGSISVLLNSATFCTTPPAVTLSVAPTALWPPNANMVPVTVSGTITDTVDCKVTSATYAVTDEYGQVQPSGSVTLGPGGAYSFTVPLQASRLGNDLDGRLYTVIVRASNNAGKTGSQTGIVIVPHDRGN